jgi:imidazolonepropionase-like amidohydrolase
VTGFLALPAILAVREGLDPDTALRSITANPQILGLADRVGALKPGSSRSGRPGRPVDLQQPGLFR